MYFSPMLKNTRKKYIKLSLLKLLYIGINRHKFFKLRVSNDVIVRGTIVAVRPYVTFFLSYPEENFISYDLR